MDQSPEDVIKSVQKAKTVRKAKNIIQKVDHLSIGEALFDELRIQLAQNYEKSIFLAKAGTALCNSVHDAPWGYRCQGVLHRLNARWVAAANSFIRASQLAGPILSPDFVVGAIDSLARASRKEQAIRLGESAYAQATENNLSHATLGRLANNIGNALAWFDELAQAEHWYEKAVKHFRKSKSPVEEASALIGLSTTTLGRNFPSRTIELSQRAKTIFDAQCASTYSATALLNIASAERLLSNGDLAIQALLEARKILDPNEEEAFRVEHDLGMIYLSLNMFTEAEASFQTALKTPWSKSNLIFKAGCLQGLAESQLGLRQSHLASKSFERAIRTYKKHGDIVWIADCLRQSLAHLPNLTKKQIVSLQSSAADLRESKQTHHLLSTLILLAKHGDEGALKESKKLIKRYPYGQFKWQIIGIQATGAKGSTRRKLFDQAIELIWQERLKVKSQASLAAFLGDKLSLINTYLRELLESANTQKALEIIVQMRSIALIDEILGATKKLDPETQTQLEKLRLEFHSHSTIQPDGSTRRLNSNSKSLNQLQKSWFEITCSLRDRIINPNLATKPFQTIFIDCDSSFYSVNSSTVTKLPFTKTELENRLRWLHFSLAEPGMKSDADHRLIVEELAILKSCLGLNWLTRQVCPESVFWTIPWQAFDSEATIATTLIPSNNTNSEITSSLENFVVWYHAAPDIPHVLEEVEFIKSQFPNATICNTTDEVKRSLQRQSIDFLHIACHGIYRPNQPAFSAFELKDGPIYAADIARSPIKIQQAILASCHSGSMSIANRNEPDGLTRSVLARGAKTVIAGQWAIDDHASLIWSKSLYTELIKTKNLEAASNFARKSVAATMPHPYFWSSFATTYGYQPQGK